MPAAIAVFGAAHAWAHGFSRSFLLAVGVLLVFGCTLAVSLHKRSENKETAWGAVRVLPDPPTTEEESVNPMSPDFLFVVGAVLFMLMALFLPYLRK